MFAIIKICGKQYNVSVGDVIKLDKIDHQVGDDVKLDNVLLVGSKDGSNNILDADSLQNSYVTAEVLEQKRDKKLLIFKKKRRKNHRRKNGHRQYITIVKIKDIVSGAKLDASKDKKSKKAA